MGTQVAITLDSQLKPNYTVSTVLATAFAVAAGELVVWIGNAHSGGKHFEVSGIRACLGKLRENGTPTPSSGKHSYAVVGVPGFRKDVTVGDDVADLTALTGTVSVTAANTAVTGVSTEFETELSVGDVIDIDGELVTVSAIASDTALTLAAAHTAGASGVAVSISNTPTELEVGIWYGDLFQQLDGSTVTPHALRALEKYLESTQKGA